ncbi:aspartate kinase [Sodaliphilus sp.]|uniref:aspartate kinase n=1 Tax=Sodaliphilus sp. TaxID=2815818 RepID=UPI00388DFB58
MKVLKFGGTSVGSVESLLNVKKIVESCTEQVIVAVSALGGVTNQLLAMCDMAEAHDAAWEQTLEQVKQRHLDIIEAVCIDGTKEQCRQVIEQFIDGNLRSYYGMLMVNQDLEDVVRSQVRDAIVAHGEIMSSAIVSCMIENAIPHFSPRFIKTRDIEGQRRLDWEATEELVKVEFEGSEEQRVVVQGFIAEDVETGLKTNLGRGGSDYTGAILAAILNASCLEIWTDVDGFMTADPRKDPNATVIPEMTYELAQEMCDAGAKVIYPPTIAPVAGKGIPVWVKNTFNPTAPGTVIK